MFKPDSLNSQKNTEKQKRTDPEDVVDATSWLINIDHPAAYWNSVGKKWCNQLWYAFCQILQNSLTAASKAVNKSMLRMLTLTWHTDVMLILTIVSMNCKQEGQEKL